ncbi:octapeptide-repeat protein T2-like [Ranitomeya imitator]|uniref:octapeptide-repeat protein T2-like n=1 Tax=Ranitomeya imitator TaxID=111125 RepID=UPI0037E902E9
MDRRRRTRRSQTSGPKEVADRQTGGERESRRPTDQRRRMQTDGKEGENIAGRRTREGGGSRPADRRKGIGGGRRPAEFEDRRTGVEGRGGRRPTNWRRRLQTDGRENCRTTERRRRRSQTNGSEKEEEVANRRTGGDDRRLENKEEVVTNWWPRGCRGQTRRMSRTEEKEDVEDGRGGGCQGQTRRMTDRRRRGGGPRPLDWRRSRTDGPD